MNGKEFRCGCIVSRAVKMIRGPGIYIGPDPQEVKQE